jgi:SnoaL-like domain
MDRDSERAIEWDCTRLVIDFYKFLDEKRYSELAALFAEDGSWTRLGRELIGPRAIVEAMNDREDWLTVHVVTNIRIDVIDGDHADTTQYITLYRHEGWDAKDGPAPVVPPLGVLRHRDKLVRRNGTWKFKQKTSRAMMTNRKRVTHYDKPAG